MHTAQIRLDKFSYHRGDEYIIFKKKLIIPSTVPGYRVIAGMKFELVYIACDLSPNLQHWGHLR